MRCLSKRGSWNPLGNSPLNISAFMYRSDSFHVIHTDGRERRIPTSPRSVHPPSKACSEPPRYRIADVREVLVQFPAGYGHRVLRTAYSTLEVLFPLAPTAVAKRLSSSLQHRNRVSRKFLMNGSYSFTPRAIPRRTLQGSHGNPTCSCRSWIQRVRTSPPRNPPCTTSVM